MRGYFRHVMNTGDMGALCVISFEGEEQFSKRLVAVTGERAKEASTVCGLFGLQIYMFSVSIQTFDLEALHSSSFIKCQSTPCD